jgi:hypothetical protein
MRVGQLSRKLDISPSEIEEFLTSVGLPPENGTNTKLSEDIVRRVVLKFRPEQISEVLEAAAADDSTEQIQEAPQEISTESVTGASPSDGPVEVIKAPKIDLPGLKVLGKIELPETPKKQPKEIPQERREVQLERSQSFRNQPSRSWKNPLEEKRKREAREQERLRREEEQAKKEQRTMAYFKKLSPAKKSPAKQKQRKEDFVQQQPVHKSPPPKSFMGKFWKWLTQADA